MSRPLQKYASTTEQIAILQERLLEPDQTEDMKEAIRGIIKGLKMKADAMARVLEATEH